VNSFRRKLAGGKEGFYLRFWDGDKHKNVPRELLPEFKSLEEAKTYAKSENAKKILFSGIARQMRANGQFLFTALFISQRKKPKKVISLDLRLLLLLL